MHSFRRTRKGVGVSMKANDKMGAKALRGRLAAAFVALVAALALAGVAGAASAVAAGSLADVAPLAGGSAVGILLDSRPDAPGADEGDRQGGDSHLGVLLRSDGRVPEVAFVSQGVEFDRVSVPYGTLIPDPGRPTWDWSRAELHGFVRGESVPAFAGWCRAQDDAGNGAGAAFGFDEPATELAYTFYAAWEDAADDASALLHVALDVRGGALERTQDPVSGKWISPDAPVVDRRVGQPWRWLPEPTRQGHAFAGWATAPEGGADALVSTEAAVAAGTSVLYAQWAPVSYTIVYVDRSDGRGAKCEQGPVSYGEPKSLLTWAEAEAKGLKRPAGKRFAGWADVRGFDGTNGTWYAGGAALTADLADTDGARVALYAQWEDEERDDSYEVRLHYNDGAPGDADDPGRTVVLDVATGTRIDAAEGYVAPKRSGYQFAGWFEDAGLDPAAEWDLSRQVLGPVELWAAWTLRLDVTVPVSVGFAVDAETGAAVGPDADAYALKSRTVVPVAVQSLALESRQAELDAFFELADDAGEGEPDGDGASGWAEALAGTRLTVAAGDADAIALPFADATADATAVAAGTWTHTRPLTPTERGDFRLAAFAYGSLAPDDAWEGAERCERLPLRLGLEVSDRLAVKIGQAGAVPITRLAVTVSAQG